MEGWERGLWGGVRWLLPALPAQVCELLHKSGRSAPPGMCPPSHNTLCTTLRKCTWILPVCPPLPTHPSLTRRDVKERCHGVAPGSARVIACLQEQREQLSPQCASRLFQHEVRLAEDIGERAGPMSKALTQLLAWSTGWVAFERAQRRM